VAQCLGGKSLVWIEIEKNIKPEAKMLIIDSKASDKRAIELETKKANNFNKNIPIPQIRAIIAACFFRITVSVDTFGF